jgi:hypothetical protein
VPYHLSSDYDDRPDNQRDVLNRVQDRTVPYPTASFTAHDPFIPISSSSLTIEDELLVETDSSHLVIKWNSIPPSSPSLTTKSEKKWYQWRTSHKTDRKVEKTKKPKPARLPPFLQFRWPFNYVSLLVADWRVIYVVELMWGWRTGFRCFI